MKRKININRPEISSEEIEKKKDFDSVLKQNAIITKPFYKKPLFLSGVAIAVIAVVTTIVLTNKKTTTNPQTTNNNQQITTGKDSLALAEFYKKEETKPCIHPPLNNI